MLISIQILSLRVVNDRTKNRARVQGVESSPLLSTLNHPEKSHSRVFCPGLHVTDMWKWNLFSFSPRASQTKANRMESKFHKVPERKSANDSRDAGARNSSVVIIHVKSREQDGLRWPRRARPASYVSRYLARRRRAPSLQTIYASAAALCYQGQASQSSASLRGDAGDGGEDAALCFWRPMKTFRQLDGKLFTPMRKLTRLHILVSVYPR